MKQNKKLKILAIISLFISVLGLTLGFAAFSNTLTISSSAAVSPDPSDFKVRFYGLNQSLVADNDWTTYVTDVSNYSSTDNVGFITGSNGFLENGKALIEEHDDYFSVSLNTKFISPGERYFYWGMVKNEGKYDVYFNVYNHDFDFTCTPGDGASPTLVASACENIETIRYIVKGSTGDKFIRVSPDASGYVKLPIGEAVFFGIDFRYEQGNGIRADGDFFVEWDDMLFEFTSAPPSE